MQTGDHSFPPIAANTLICLVRMRGLEPPLSLPQPEPGILARLRQFRHIRTREGATPYLPTGGPFEVKSVGLHAT